MIVSSYSYIDASAGEYQEEEGFYPEEEEEDFDHLNSQGKLTPLQVLLLQDNTLAKCKAHHDQGITHLLYVHDPISQFYFTSFTYLCFIKVLLNSWFTGLVLD